MLLPLATLLPVIATRLLAKKFKKHQKPSPDNPVQKHGNCLSSLSRRLTVSATIILFMFYFPIAKAVLGIFNLYPHGVLDPSTGETSFYLQEDMSKVAYSSTHQVRIPLVTLAVYSNGTTSPFPIGIYRLRNCLPGSLCCWLTCVGHASDIFVAKEITWPLQGKSKWQWCGINGGCRK